MLPIRLEIRNFIAYRSPDPVVFEGVHLACLTGPNGAGKTSLLDAITWALWGKARARRDEEMIHMGQADMYVQLDFEQEGLLFRVVRKRTRRAGGQGTLICSRMTRLKIGGYRRTKAVCAPPSRRSRGCCGSTMKRSSTQRFYSRGAPTHSRSRRRRSASRFSLIFLA
ncbi:MAG: AAA family ATPase [Blastochloris sp.]|nr:AAA family ATPase [Blastochloris sp.]